MSDLTQVAVYSDSSDIYKNVFCNPTFELEGEQESKVEGFRITSSTPEPIKPPASSQGMFGACAMHLRGPGCSWGAVVVSAAVVFLVTALGLALVLILTQINRQPVEGEQQLDLLSGVEVSHTLPNLPGNSSNSDGTTTATPPLATRPASQTRCGGVLSDTEGSFSSPNHPGSYPPNSLCVWVIRVQPPQLVQVHVSSLTVEGPSPCLFDWLEVQERRDQGSVVTRWVDRSWRAAYS